MPYFRVFQTIDAFNKQNKNMIWNLNPLILKVIFFSCLSSIALNSQTSWTELSGPNEIDILANFISKNGQIYQYTSTKEIFISYDKGKSWKSNSLGLIKAEDTCYTSNYFFKETPDGNIYFHGECMLYSLNMTSMSWNVINRNIKLLDLCFSKDGSNIFAGDYYNLYLSNDSGRTFISKFYQRVNNLKIYSFGKDSNIVEKDLGKRIARYKFDDNLNSFTEITSGGSGGPIIFVEDTKTLHSFEINKFAKSEDFGETWQDFNFNMLNNYYCYYATYFDDNSILLFGNINYRSFDAGLTWQVDSIYDSFGTLGAQKVSKSDAKEFVVFNQGQSFLLAPQKKLNYINIPIPKPYILEINQNLENTILCRTNQTLQISKNDGASWQEINRNVDFVRTFRNGDILVVNSNGLISYSQDHGASWKEIPFGRKFRHGMNIHINSKDEILVIYYDSIYLSDNKGISWSKQFHSLEYNYYELPKLSANDILYSRYIDSIYYSNDFGKTVNKFKADNANRNGYIHLSKNNVFYWIREDFWTEDLEIVYSKDYGRTKEIHYRQWPDQLLLIDDDDNIYVCTDQKIYSSLDIFSLVNNIPSKNYSFNGISKAAYDCVENLTLGQDHHLYCSLPYHPLYKTNGKVLTDPIGIKETLKEKNEQLCVTSNSHITTISLPEDWDVTQSHVLIMDSFGKQLTMFSKQLNKIIIDNNSIICGIYYFNIFSYSGKHISSKLLIGR